MAIQDRLSDRLGPYRLLDRIGEGGMGVVHLAADSENRLVAIKVLRPQTAGDATARRRLAREVETMRRVRSPYVAEVIDADVTGDMPYIVTRFVPGSTLEQVVAEHGPLRGQRLQRLAYGLAGALAGVHAAGVVHRDLKPGNVLIVGDDPVVIDFGIAQAGDATRLTLTGMFMGTPGYLAPEVIEGQRSGPASDVHSWGATVAFAARGEPPYGTGMYEAVFFRILQGNANLDGIHGALYPLITAALAREPAQRPTAAWLASHVARLDLTAPTVAGATSATAIQGVLKPSPVVPGMALAGETVPNMAVGAAAADAAAGGAARATAVSGMPATSALGATAGTGTAGAGTGTAGAGTGTAGAGTGTAGAGTGTASAGTGAASNAAAASAAAQAAATLANQVAAAHLKAGAAPGAANKLAPSRRLFRAWLGNRRRSRGIGRPQIPMQGYQWATDTPGSVPPGGRATRDSVAAGRQIAPGSVTAGGLATPDTAAAGGRATPDTAAAGGPATTGSVAPEDHMPRYQRPRDVADLLPPVQYVPSAEGARRRAQQAEQGRTASAANLADSPRRAPALRKHRVLGLAALVIAIAISLVLPVAGTMAVLGVLAVLRAADRAQRRLAFRRSTRGPRAVDPLLVVANAPWALARAVLVTLLLAPLLMFIAGIVAVVAAIAMGGSQLALAAAYAAGVFMALNCVGPGSRAPRRELNRAFNAIARTRLATAAFTLMLGSFAAALVSLALLKAPTFWPVPDPHNLLAHLPGAGLVRHLAHPPGAGLVRHLAHPPGGGLIHRTLVFLRHVGHGLTGSMQVL